MPKLKIKTYQYALLLLIVFILLIIAFGNKAKSPTEILPSPTPLPKSKFTNLPQGLDNQAESVSYTTSLKIPPELPKSLPKYVAAPLAVQDIIKQLQSGFSVNEPEYTKQNSFEKYTWIINQAELTYYPAKSSVLFVDINSPEGKALPLEAAQESALEFINRHFSIDPQLKLKLINSHYLKGSKTVVVDAKWEGEANFNELEYQFQLENVPLILPPHEQPSVQILLNDKGVRKVRLMLPPQLSRQEQEIALSGINQAITAVVSNQGIILRERAVQILDGAPSFDVSKIKITNVEAGYLFNNSLNPVYLFTGEAPNNNYPTYKHIITVTAPAAQ